MANVLFESARESFLKGEVAWGADSIRAVLVNHGAHAPSPTTDRFLSDIASGARVATSGTFTAKTTAAGVADADDITFSSVSGAAIDSMVIYQDTGSASTSRLTQH